MTSQLDFEILSRKCGNKTAPAYMDCCHVTGLLAMTVRIAECEFVAIRFVLMQITKSCSKRILTCAPRQVYLLVQFAQLVRQVSALCIAAIDISHPFFLLVAQAEELLPLLELFCLQALQLLCHCRQSACLHLLTQQPIGCINLMYP